MGISRKGVIMDRNSLRNLLLQVRKGKVGINEAMETLSCLPFSDLGFAKIDHHRSIRTGIPEVVFCSGKTVAQVIEILECILRREGKGAVILTTRVPDSMAPAILQHYPSANHNREGRTITIGKPKQVKGVLPIGIVTAGTSDIPVAEEARATVEAFGHPVRMLHDVGVAGIHRLFYSLKTLRSFGALIVAAGMEGALPSVIGGLLDCPVIAVPTSVGYGASFGGIAALLGMLNSCSPGVTVVNIDNGFGAAVAAVRINSMRRAGRR